MTDRSRQDLEPASNIEWRAWGARDPLFAVSAQAGREREGANPWTEDEFYALGARDWASFAPHWRAYGLDNASAVEIGCGAGRITRLLAAEFDEVHGLDVSPEMLRFAAARVQADNVRWHVTDGMRWPLPDGAATAAFSTHVFQHFDNLGYALETFREVARVLRPGGTMMVHLPIYSWPLGPGLLEAVYRGWKWVGDGRAKIRRHLLGWGVGRPIMRRLAYPLRWLYESLPSVGLGDVEVRIITPARTNDPHPFVLARRGGA